MCQGKEHLEEKLNEYETRQKNNEPISATEKDRKNNRIPRLFLVVELFAMNKQGGKSTWPLAQIRTSRLRSCACALALAAMLCCIAVPIGALADENPPDEPGLSEEDLSSESSEPSEPSEPPEGTDSDAGTDTETEDDSGASENSSDITDSGDNLDTDSSSDENPENGEASDTTASTETKSEEADSPTDETAGNDFVEESRESQDSDSIEDADGEPVEEDEEETDSDSAEDDEEEDARDGKIERKQKTPEEEALDKLEQASAIYDHMSRLANEIEVLQERYDELEAASDKASSRHKELREALKRERKKYDELKEEISSHVVKMYKQGGITPYLDVLCGTASFEEFLSLWYTLDKISHFGEREFHEQAKVVKALEAKLGEADDRIEAAEKEADEALTKLNRARLTYLSLAPHAASLKMEAFETLGDSEGFASAQAEYESAYAELQNALDQGLAEASRLEGEGIFTNPCPDAEYSSGFGYRTFDNAYHLGLDMAIGEGTPYYAADDGVVIEATNGGGYNGGAGNWIVIDHGNGVVTKYMHSAVTFVSPGETVVRGQNIGLVGNTGNSSGPHLHFQVEIDGVAVDPLVYL